MEKQPESHVAVSPPIIPVVIPPPRDVICRERGMASLAILSGGLYFFISAAGADNLKKLFGLQDKALHIIYGIGAGASISYAMLTYKVLENLTLFPELCLGWTLSVLSPFAASTFLIAGIEGAHALSVPSLAAILIGIILFLLRIMTMLDGSVKFPGRSAEVVLSWRKAFSENNYKEMLRLALTIYTAIGYSLSMTDAIYLAAVTIGTWFGANSENVILSICSYISCGLGALGSLPMIFYWTHRGIKQLTFGGQPDETTGENKDPTDKMTYIAMFMTIPVILGGLGSATSAHDQAFARLGLAATVIRVSSSVLYSVCGGVPGLATLGRGLSTYKPSFFNASSCCKKNDDPTIKEALLPTAQNGR